MSFKFTEKVAKQRDIDFHRIKPVKKLTADTEFFFFVKPTEVLRTVPNRRNAFCFQLTCYLVG